jgi:hypothetical protein
MISTGSQEFHRILRFDFPAILCGFDLEPDQSEMFYDPSKDWSLFISFPFRSKGYTQLWPKRQLLQQSTKFATAPAHCVWKMG